LQQTVIHTSDVRVHVLGVGAVLEACVAGLGSVAG
jgi:hypothetical protein